MNREKLIRDAVAIPEGEVRPAKPYITAGDARFLLELLDDLRKEQEK